MLASSDSESEEDLDNEDSLFPETEEHDISVDISNNNLIPAIKIPDGNQKEEVSKPLCKQSVEHVNKLQLYVFVCRCVAYPYNSKQDTDIPCHDAKLNCNDLSDVLHNIDTYLKTGGDSVVGQEYFDAVQCYRDECLSGPKIGKLAVSGGLSFDGLVNIFKSCMQQFLIEEDESKEQVEAIWIKMFHIVCGRTKQTSKESNAIMTNAQLYEMFQSILSVKKYEHQILFNACQVSRIILFHCFLIFILYYRCIHSEAPFSLHFYSNRVFIGIYMQQCYRKNKIAVFSIKKMSCI